MDNKPYTLEAMAQIEKIYASLDRLPPGKRSIVMLMVEAFINGMEAQANLTV